MTVHVVASGVPEPLTFRGAEAETLFKAYVEAVSADDAFLEV